MAAKDKLHALGFSFVELLAALAIVGILASLSVASFSRLIAESHISSNVSHLVHILHLARQTSWTTGEDVVLCSSSSGSQCQNARNWETGWLLFSNLDKDDPPQADPGEPVHRMGGPLLNTAVLANRRAFIMRPFGRRSTNGTLIYCDRRGLSDARAIIVSYTGKARQSRRNANGSNLNCPAAGQ